MLVVNPDHTICIAGEQHGAFPVRIRTMAAGTYTDDDVTIRVTTIEDAHPPIHHRVSLEYEQPYIRTGSCYRHVGGLICFAVCLGISYTLWISEISRT